MVVNKLTVIEVKNLVLKYHVYTNQKRSVKNRLIDMAFAGAIRNDKDATHVLAIDNISFDVNYGDKIGIIGGNGSGKTTLLRSLMGIYEPYSGNITCHKKITSMIDIELGIDEDATGYDNILLRALVLGISKNKIGKLIPSIEEFSELGEYLSLPVRTYSSGMKVRLAFSILTALEPEIVLMDEWLSVGDKDFKEKATQKLNEIISKASCLIIASHDFGQLKKICNRIFHLEKGKIIKELKPSDLD